MIDNQNQTIPNDRWLTVNDVALYLSVKPDTVYKWLDQKKIPAHKIGRLWRFKSVEIDAWVCNSSKKPYSNNH